MDNTKEKQLSIRPEIARGVYANIAIFSHTDKEFVLDFASVLPGMPGAEVQSRVIMTPGNVKSVLLALQENINKYEAQFGHIEPGIGPQQNGGTINLSDIDLNSLNGGSKS